MDCNIQLGMVFLMDYMHGLWVSDEENPLKMYKKNPENYLLFYFISFLSLSKMFIRIS